MLISFQCFVTMVATWTCKTHKHAMALAICNSFEAPHLHLLLSNSAAHIGFHSWRPTRWTWLCNSPCRDWLGFNEVRSIYKIGCAQLIQNQHANYRSKPKKKQKGGQKKKKNKPQRGPSIVHTVLDSEGEGKSVEVPNIWLWDHHPEPFPPSASRSISTTTLKPFQLDCGGM